MFEDCVEDGCDEVAVKSGRWQPRQKKSQPLAVNPWPRDPLRCRPHHLVAIADRIETWQVIGPMGIVDIVTRDTVHEGGVVRLDPAETNIGILRRLKWVGPVEQPAAASGKASAGKVAAEPAKA